MANRRFQKRGTFWIKTRDEAVVQADGAEVTIFMKVLPAYVQPREFWFSIRGVGTGTLVAPSATQQYALRGGVFELPREFNQTNPDTSLDWTLDELLEKYTQAKETSAANAADDPLVDTGLPEETVPFHSDWAKERTFYTRGGELGLPQNAVFADASGMVYLFNERGNGKISVPAAIDDNKLIFCSVVTDHQGGLTDIHAYTLGGENEPADLLTTLYEFIGSSQDPQNLSDEVSASSTLSNWMASGHNEAVTSTEQALHVTGRFTVKCDLYEPSQSRFLSPSVYS